MRRRDFLALASGAAAWPVTAQAQGTGRLPIIGVLATATPAVWEPWIAALVGRLRELGWVEEKTVAIEVRWAEGRTERYREIAADFVRLNVDVIVTDSAAAFVAKQVTAAVPIVFGLSADPLGTGLVASLARPGGNVTGISVQSANLAGKKLELLNEAVPGVKRIAIMGNAGFPAAVLEIQEARKAAGILHLESVTLEVRRSEDIAPALQEQKDRIGALYVCIDPLVGTNINTINALALANRWPTMHGLRGYVAAGGLMSYGASIPVLFRRAAEMVDRILRGTKPGEIPVEQPTEFALVINLKTAKTLGLEIPQTLLARADEVIE